MCSFQLRDCSEPVKYARREGVHRSIGFISFGRS